jgi:alkylation response protein AidB-like acyl-CoA dehydrogenase
MELDDVAVPAENMLGKENQGFEIIMSSMIPRKIYQFSQ